MALEPISNAVYQDIAKPAVKPIVTTTGQDSSANTINIAEVPTTSKVNTTNQTDKDNNNLQDGKQNGQSGNQNGAPTEKQIKEAVSKVNSQLRPHRTRCEFNYHEDINRVSIKVIDKDTDKVIKEIPSEDILAMVEKIYELEGLLVDERR